MTEPPTRHGIRRRIYSLSLVDEFGPLYAVYTLWFSDNGVTASQISTVFVLWAAVAIVLEVPSGALADRVDRRHLLAGAFVLRAAGIAVWLLTPTYAGMLVGAAAWAIHSTFASGAWEANIHDQLSAVGQADSYGTVIARVGQFSNLGIAAGTVIAFAALELKASILALGWLTVAIHAASITLVLTMPNVRWVVEQADPTTDLGNHDRGEHDHAEEPTTYRAWLVGIRAGIAEATAAGPVLRLLVLGALVEGLFVVDEFVPLLARERGVTDEIVPLFVLVVWIGLLLGGELVARRPDLSGRSLGPTVTIGALAMFGAIWSETAPALLLVGLGYAGLEALLTVSDARLQERVGSRHRATVTSVRGLMAGVIGTLAFAVISVLSSDDDPGLGLLVILVALAVVGVLAVFWLPSGGGRDPGSNTSPADSAPS